MAVPTIEQVFSFFGRQNPCGFEDFILAYSFLWGGGGYNLKFGAFIVSYKSSMFV